MLTRLVLLGSLLAGTASLACTPDASRLNDKQAFVGVNGWSNGDICKIADFPAPWNTVLGMTLGPGKGQFSWAYEDKQYGAAWIQIGPEGKGRIVFHYSNMKAVDGDHFTAAIDFLDANSKVVMRVESLRGLDPKTTGEDVKNIDFDKAKLATVTQLRFYHGYYDEVDDKAVWDAVLQAGKAACGDDCKTY